MNTPVEDDLRAMLTRQAGTVPVRSDPYGLVNQRMVRNRRRTLVGAAVAAALVILAAVLGAPMVAKLSARDFAPAEQSVENWPARGELARDPGVRAYLDRVYDGEGDELQLLFAGDVGDRRYVIVRAEGDPAIIVLVSPAGTYADKKAGDFVPGLPGQGAWAFVDRRQVDDPTTVFLLAPPGADSADYSAGPIVAEDGRMARRWDHLEREDDGVFVGQAQYDPSWQFRARAAKGNRVEVDVDAAPLFSRAPAPSARLTAFAADATNGQELPGLAQALLHLETSTLGPREITAVSVRWRDQKTPWDLYAGIALDVMGGGSVELVVDNHGTIHEARPVARGQAWKQAPAPGTYPRDAPNPNDVLDVPSSVGERLR